MRTIFIALIVFALQIPGCAQNKNKTNASTTKHVGGSCEGCEAIFESPIPFSQLKPVDTLPDFNEPGPKMEISGIVFQRDGKTPARDVVLYVYHTDQTGRYTPGANARGWEKRHGAIRGWMRTNQNGVYKFFTLKPGHYPNTNIPAHIHITIKEPDKNEYYIDEYLFEGDPYLTASEISKQEKRGGSGVISVENKGGMLHGKRDIILGLNIPNY